MNSLCLSPAVAFLILWGTPALNAEEPLAERIDRLAEPYVESKTIVSMTIGVLHDGEETIRGYGRIRGNRGEAPDGDTVFEIGSVSKAFTGVLLADAVVEGLVTLDQPAQELLPKSVKMPTKGEAPITLVHLATHTSGLPRLPENLEATNPENPYADYGGRRLAEFLNGYELDREPGEKSEYSNLGMGLLGRLVARRHGMNYEEAIVQRIATPLGMEDTSIALSDDQRSRLAPPHDGARRRAKNWDLGVLAGAGAIRSTTRDMLRFAAANLDPPEGPLGEAIELAWEVHQPSIEESFDMGLGWHVARDGQTRWHNGQTGGYHAALFINRPAQAAVVLLTNTGTGEVDVLAQDVVRMLAGATVEPRKFDDGIDVPVEVVRRYVGKYQLAPDFVFTVSEEDGQLMVGVTNQPTFRVYPKSETEWFYKVVEATLTFDVNRRGEATAVTLFQNGVRQRAKRVK